MDIIQIIFLLQFCVDITYCVESFYLGSGIQLLKSSCASYMVLFFVKWNILENIFKGSEVDKK